MTFGRPSLKDQRARRRAEKKAHLRTLMQPTRTLHSSTFNGGTTGPVLKDIKARPGKRTPTVAERAWMDAVVAFGCVACRIAGLAPRPCCVHHILRGGQRIGHFWTLGLCDPGHHQNGQPLGMVSRHPYRARFEKAFGAELDLLQYTIRALAWTNHPASHAERASAAIENVAP